MQLGMGSALETLCGQAYGAGKLRMLGIYMQRSWVILLVTACLMLPLYIWAPPILEVIGQTTEISNAAGWYQCFALIKTKSSIKLHLNVLRLLGQLVSLNDYQLIYSRLMVSEMTQL